MPQAPGELRLELFGRAALCCCVLWRLDMLRGFNNNNNNKVSLLRGFNNNNN